MTTKEKSRGVIMGLACGDALGRETEFINNREEFVSIYGPNGVTDLPCEPLYTDDTQMTISLGKALLDTKEDDVDEFMTHLSVRFLEWLETQSDPKHIRSPGHTCIAACQNLKAGMDWSQSGIETSCGCGSAMRSAPIGIVFSDPGQVTNYAIRSSQITHGHELALCGGAATALLTRYAIEDVPIGCWGNSLLKVVSINSHFKNLIRTAVDMAAERQDPDFVLSSNCLGEGWTAHDAVASALYCCLMNPNSYKDTVIMAANAVGDSDSIACIAGAIMGGKLGFDAIPKEWSDVIEERESLLDLADKLSEKTFTPQSSE